MMPPTPVVLSPALPSELLSYIIKNEIYPTTLIICSPRAEFLACLADDVQGPAETPEQPQRLAEDQSKRTSGSLLSAPLYQVAVTRHIRIVFMPTVSHLRAFLSVFALADSKIPPPPQTGDRTTHNSKGHPLLLVYGFLGLHRNTSEWSAQGLSSTAAGLVETAKRVKLQAVIVDPPSQDGEEEGPEGLISEEVPVLSASARRAGPDTDEGGWTGRTVRLSRVLGRWFRFRDGEWAVDRVERERQ